MAVDRLIIGTRGSDLALWQAQWVHHALQTHFPQLAVELITIKTKGDKILDSPLSKVGDKGLFTREIEFALLDKRIDVAVHSLKDIPTQIPEGLAIGAITEREDVRDAFIARPSHPVASLDALPRGASIATGSLRRKSQLLHYRPDLTIVDIRGNLRTRFRRLDESEWNGMLLAYAGVRRLEMESRISFLFPPSTLLPAVGQGALAIEIRIGDERIQHYVSSLQHEPTAIAVLGERALLRRLEGGCQIPIGAYGEVRGTQLSIDAMVGSLDGSAMIRDTANGTADDPETLGRELAERILAKGADAILQSIRAETAAN